MKRYYERNDHDYYGPVRRCWVMLVGLYGTDLSIVDEYYGYEWGVLWDDDLIEFLDADMSEQAALQTVLRRVLDCTPDVD